MDATLAHMVREEDPGQAGAAELGPVPPSCAAVQGSDPRGATRVGVFRSRGRDPRDQRAVRDREFKEFDHTKENEAHIFELIEAQNLQKYGKPTYWVARPTATRLEEKDTRRRELDDPRLATLKEQASAIYRSLVPAASPS